MYTFNLNKDTIDSVVSSLAFIQIDAFERYGLKLFYTTAGDIATITRLKLSCLCATMDDEIHSLQNILHELNTYITNDGVVVEIKLWKLFKGRLVLSCDPKVDIEFTFIEDDTQNKIYCLDNRILEVLKKRPATFVDLKKALSINTDDLDNRLMSLYKHRRIV